MLGLSSLEVFVPFLIKLKKENFKLYEKNVSKRFFCILKETMGLSHQQEKKLYMKKERSVMWK